MNKKDFKFCMQQGRGQCHLTLKSETNIEKYKEIVLWGCLHNLAYDAQCEGTRAEYVYNLTKFFNDEDYFLLPIINAFETLPNRRDWLFYHFSTQLSLFASNGNERARHAIQRKYDQLFSILLNKRSFRSYDFERDNFERLCIALLPLGDANINYKMICDMGRLFRENPHYDCDYFDWFCSCIEGDLGKERLHRLLKHDSTKSADIKCFYESYLKLKEEENKRKLARRPMEAPSVEKIKEEVSSSGKLSPYSRVSFSRCAEAEERKKLAEEAVAEADLDKKAELLSTFAFRDEGFPLSHEIIIEYANSSHERLHEVSLDVLTNCQSKIVRDYALSLMADEKHKTYALKMLLCNYTPKDKQFLLGELNKLKVTYDDESNWHDIGFQIRNVCDQGVRLPKEFSIYIYNTTLCSCCREYTISALAKHRWLTRDIIEECRYDSNDKITDYINRYYPQK